MINCKDNIASDTTDSLIFANGESDRLIVTLGVSDLVIVDTKDVLMVCEKSYAQNVKQVVSLLNEKGKNHYL